MLKQLSNDRLWQETHQAVREERQANLLVLRHLREISDRKLYLERGYPSLFEACMKEFGYSASAAQRRIEAMRLIKDLPEIEQKVEEGTLSLSVVSQAQTFFRREAKAEHTYTPDEKREILKNLEGKSTREVERELVKLNPQAAAPEKTRWLNEDRIELRLSVDSKTYQDLETLKHLLSHKDPCMSYETLLKELAQMALDKLDPARKQERVEKRRKAAAITPSATASSTEAPSPRAASESQQLTLVVDESHGSVPAPVVRAHHSSLHETPPKDEHETTRKTSNHTPQPPMQTASRHIPAEVARRVRLRDQNRCTYRDPQTGRVCGSTHLTQIDHVHPHALGGSNDETNLRILCAAHNQRRARKTWSMSKMRDS